MKRRRVGEGQFADDRSGRALQQHVRLVVERVRFDYGSLRVLNDLSWSVSSGVTGLLGPNGSGKTTLLNLLVGIAQPKSGVVRFVGENPADDDARVGQVRVGFVPQRFSVAGEMRVLDTVAYAAWSNGVPARESAEAALRALATVQLEDLAGRRARQLSGGQRQRMGLAAALAHEPEFVVLDEPTVGLDPGQRLRVREVVADIGRTRTVVLSTHLIEDIAHLCGRVGVLAHGQMAFDGTEAELARLIEDTDQSGVLGSSFEKSYHALIERLGADDE